MAETKVRNISIDAMEEALGNAVKVEEKTKSTSKFNPKNYLDVNLDIEHGETSKELRIRLLPIDKDHNVPFKLVKMHNVKVPKEVSKSGYKNYLCLEQVEDIDHDKFGRKCPFCEMRRNAYKESMETNDMDERARLQKISCSYIIQNDTCIFRCIERGHEEDGPKFWKFNLHSDNSDPLRKILALAKTRRDESREEGEDLDILDVYNGKDLKITISASIDKNTGKPTNKKSVEVIDIGTKTKPISDNPDQIEEWVNDSKIWSDVFTPKSYDYMSILLDGDIPWFDSKQQKWVKKDDSYAQNNKVESEKSDIEIEKAKEEEKKVNKAVVTEDEELPF